MDSWLPRTGRAACAEELAVVVVAERHQLTSYRGHHVAPARGIQPGGPQRCESICGAPCAALEGGMGVTTFAGEPIERAARMVARLCCLGRRAELVQIGEPLQRALLSDTTLLSAAVIDALGLREVPGRPLLDTLIGYLRERRNPGRTRQL
jgi:hypothetical protein